MGARVDVLPPDVGADQVIAVAQELKIMGVGPAPDAIESAYEAAVEAVDLPSRRTESVVVPEKVPVGEHPEAVDLPVDPPDRHPVVVEDHPVLLAHGDERAGRREVLRGHRSRAGECVFGEIVRQTTHVVAVESLRTPRLPYVDDEGTPGTERHRLAEVAAAERTLVDRSLQG